MTETAVGIGDQDSDASLDELRKALDYWIELFDRRRRRNKILCTVFRVLIIALSALITITLAIDLSGLFSAADSKYFKLAAIIYSAFGISLSSFEAFIDHKRLWINAGAALSSAALLRQRLNVAAAKHKVDSSLIDVTFRELTLIVDTIVKEWTDSRTLNPDVLNQENFGGQHFQPKIKKRR